MKRVKTLTAKVDGTFVEVKVTIESERLMRWESDKQIDEFASDILRQFDRLHYRQIPLSRVKVK